MRILHRWRIAWATLATGFALLWSVTAVQAQESSQWVRHVGNNQDVQVTAVSLSAAGEVFVAGLFRGTIDFDPGPG
jgi:hypothetical protein